VGGIAGFLQLDGRPVDPGKLDLLLSGVRHRGPDGSASWADGPIGIGCTSLHTTRESTGERVPVVTAGGELVVTADARLDNRDELLRQQELGAFGVRGPNEVGDAELISRAYGAWGDRCPERLLGDFAFGIWDARRRAVLCARDPMGARPLYFSHRDGGFAFASSPQAIVASRHLPKRIDETALAAHLLGADEDPTRTFYRGISRLPPGHWLCADARGIRITAYWSPDPGREIALGSDEEYADAFREILGRAVRARLRSRSAVGCMLSGGVDSSSVACTARDLSSGSPVGLHTFSCVAEDPIRCRESQSIEAVVRLGGFEHRAVRPAEIGDFVEDLSRPFHHADDPWDATCGILYRVMYAAARRSGVRVLLDGVGADLALSYGSDYFYELLRSPRPGSVREAFSLSRHLGPLLLVDAVRQWLEVRRAPSSARLSGARRCSLPAGANRLLRTEFLQRAAAGRGEEVPTRGATGTSCGTRHHHARRMMSASARFAVESLDRAAAACSIEPRHPFLDQRLVEFCLALPADQKIRRGWTKWVLRRSAARLVPRPIPWRRDRVNLVGRATREVLRLHQPWLARTVSDDLEPIADYFDIRSVREAYDRYSSSGGLLDSDLWEVASFAAWARGSRAEP